MNTTTTNRDEKVAAARDALAKGLGALQTSEDWQTLLDTVAKSARRRLSPRRYSFGNQVIVWATAQARGVDGSAVGTFKAWEDVGRRIQKGQKAIYILQPRPWTKESKNDKGETEVTGGVYFRALPVFVIGQTEGADLPATPSLLGEISDDARFATHLDELRTVAMGIDGKPVESFEVRARCAGEPSKALGWYVPATRGIVVVDTGNSASMFKVAVHEVPHSLMHGTAEHHEYARNEVEAESVAYIVSRVFDLDTAEYSFPYVTTWVRGNAAETDPLKVVQASGERILRAVNTILDALLSAATDEQAEETQAA